MTPAAHTTEDAFSRNLWGSDARKNTGILQIICGIIEFAFGIATIYLTLKDYYRLNIDDYVSCGIWNGVCAVATGCLGVKSKRRRGMYNYSAHPYYSNYSYYSLYNFSDGYPYARAHFAMHVILDLVFGLQILISIIGASFTCRVICFKNNQLHPV
ncbi:hypothetical protein HOLleu_20731 [Holothuria leucospilota]|uniref:Uncharacterized protein n=1 Tax=Holothuria leucospilota TaxID=206669 RepID=A0A9Q1C1G4_HOLLE|nr:hypothetical protein HOLleu_20731 [Holothuria leucospilota]